ncbi:S41 family peptidase [Marinoscillum sp.]|uniref:S41 family peptidase n=1 Tax=Marinoscillum sp. TaxID=2024838 RepID=UPI003BA90636
MKLGKILLLVTALYSLPTSAQPLVLMPDLSPDGSQIAFSYQGDIWTVPVAGGRADRLTLHEAYETNPKWSADGSQIAFQSDRYGNNDLFLMKAGGGVPERLTFHSSSDGLYDFTADGDLIFLTRRLYAQVEREWEIQKVSIEGGTPTLLIDALGLDPVVSPDGSKVAFVRGTCRVAREAYQGPANRDVWMYDFNTGEYTQLTDFDGNDHSPQWKDNNTLLYITSESGKYNIHEMPLGGSTTQLTNEEEFGVNSFSVAENGVIVYQTGDQVKVMSGGTTSAISIDVSSDLRFDEEVSKTISNNLEGYAISPNGKYAAYITRGEVFVRMTDKEFNRSVRVTDTPAREREVVWLNDETLLFTSDRAGQYDLYTAYSTDASEKDIFKSLKHGVKRITNTPEDESSLVMSPDLKKLAYQQNRGKLLVTDISSSGNLSNQKVLQDGWDSPGGVAWSPDSKWLAYSMSDLNFNDEIYIHAADNSSKPVNVSMHPKRDSNPVWSRDGSKLGFLSSRNNGDADIWFVWLKKEDWEKTRLQRDWYPEDDKKDKPKTDADSKDKKGKDKGEDKSDEVEPIVIDFEKIYERLSQVTSYAGNESDFAFDKKGEFIYYTLGSAGRQDYEVERNLFKIKWDGSENKELAGGDIRPYRFTLDADGKYIYMITRGGKLERVKTNDDKKETLSTSSKLMVNYTAELEQLFEEGWRALDQGFYDPNFHGRDWAALKAKYKPLALKASTKEDFEDIYNLMLGQLNASHMGYRSGENQKETQRQRTGLLGVSGVNVDGGFQVNKILTNSPADRAESKLMVGDVIKSVNQVPVTASTNFYSLLVDENDNPILLEVARSGQTKEVVIWPSNSLYRELYDDWVETRRKLVDEYSRGKLGYLHIQGMNWSSFERFERELMAAGYEKEGIVIDVRYNGGGWTTDYLMAVLSVRQHAYTVPRGATDNLQENHLKFKETYPFAERLPLASWTKPSIALCNENSYSNAEIFSHAYKTLDLGTLVGQPTFGAVISTGGYGLIDGSYVRMPFRAWYVKATEENMEHGPAVPDILVENPPAYKANNVDPQLKRAVEELLGQL